MLLLPAGQVFAATINVDATCSLANAINEANGETTGVGSCEAGTDGNGATGADTIELSGNITLAARPPYIASHITINGNGYAIDGASAHHIFYGRQTSAVSISLTLNNLTIRNGFITPTTDSVLLSGGAIGITSGSGLATLTIDNSTFHGNLGINSVVRQSTLGGAISCSYVNLTITDSVFYDNEATNGGAVSCAGNVTIKRSSFYNNTALNNSGALDIASMGFGFAATVLIENSSFYGNTTTATASNVSGGTIALNLKDASSPGSATLRHVTVTRNSSARPAKGLYNDSLASSPLHIQNSILYGNGGNDCQINAGAGAPATNSGNIIGSGNCGTPFSTADPLLASSATGSPPYFTFREDSPARNAATCISGVTTDQRGTSRPQGSLCDIGAYEGPGHAAPPPPPTQVNNPPPPPPPRPRQEQRGSTSSAGDSGAIYIPPNATPSATATPGISTCLTLPGIVTYNLTESTQCQRLNAEGIGNAEIAAAGFVDAINVWSWILPGTKICFEAEGSAFKFIDTTALPRVVYDVSATNENGLTCATIDRAGNLILLPGNRPPAAPTPKPALEALSLQNCMARTTNILNFRASPGGDVIRAVPYNATLTAVARTADWFKVDFHGVKGWISAAFVEQIGDCG